MSQDGPVCSVLKIGELTILLDCGWDCDFKMDDLLPLEEVASSIDVILLSSSSMTVR